MKEEDLIGTRKMHCRQEEEADDDPNLNVPIDSPTMDQGEERLRENHGRRKE